MPVSRSLPIFALLVTLAAPLAAQAQTSPAPVDSAAPMMESGHHRHHHQSFMHALHAVSLTPSQQQQVAAFHDQETKANLNADAGTRKANAQKMRDQIMGILTPDQKAQLTAQLHRSKNHTPGMAPNPAPTPGAN